MISFKVNGKRYEVEVPADTPLLWVIRATRREFLKQSLAGAGLTIALTVTPFGYRLLSAAELGKGAVFSPNAWLRVTPDNLVTIFINNSEMGQGVTTALPMIVADEMEADWALIRVVEAPAGPLYVDPVSKQQLAGGSSSVKNMYRPLRQAGATAREMLVAAAAQTWQVPAGECQPVQGSVRHAGSGRALSFGELAETAAKLQVPRNPRLKDESRFGFIGRPMPRLDIPEKVSGSARFEGGWK